MSDRVTAAKGTAGSVRDAVKAALTEDHAADDITTRWVVPEDARVAGYVVAREAGIVAGVDVAVEVYRQVDARVRVVPLVADGERVASGEQVLTIQGPARSVITGERVALNFLQRMSGIATGAGLFVTEVAGLETKILDTRKTVPGLRALDKYAVTCGGATNHRRDLSAMVLIKENHIAAAGGVSAAVHAVRVGQTVEERMAEIEVEVTTGDEAVEAMALGVDWVLLDNMTPRQMGEIVARRNATPKFSGVRLEASGTIVLANVREVAKSGVDAISVGALTHSVKALDLSMLVDRV